MVAAIGFGEDRLYKAMKAGKLKAKRIVGRTMILAESLEKWLHEKPDYAPRYVASTSSAKRRKCAKLHDTQK